MKITGSTLMVNFETEVKLGKNDAIELTLQHGAFINTLGKSDIDIDLDLSQDITDVKFLGLAIGNNYNDFKKFKAQLLELGIDLNALIDEKEKELLALGLKDKLKAIYKDTVKYSSYVGNLSQTINN
jgi:hypothetical protein